MAELLTASGDVVLVDEADVPRLLDKRLYSVSTSNATYATYSIKGPSGLWVTRLVHRLLMDAPSGIQVDHRNFNGLDNRRHNLRLATHSQNQQNRRGHGVTSQYKGVSWDRTNGRWTAHIQVAGKQKNLGRFVDEILAAQTYDAAAARAFGEFALLNFPSDFAA